MRTAALALSLYALILAVVAGATWLGNGGHYGVDDQPRVEQAATYSDTVEDPTCPTAEPCAAVAGQTDVEQLGIYTEQPSTAPCTTDAECDAYAFHAGWDTTPLLVPSADGGEGYVCPMGGELYDTLQPALGDSGVVCRNVYLQT